MRFSSDDSRLPSLTFFFSFLPTTKKTPKQSIAPTAEEEEERDACDAWVAALVDAEIADEQQEALYLEENDALMLASAISAVSVQ